MSSVVMKFISILFFCCCLCWPAYAQQVSPSHDADSILHSMSPAEVRSADKRIAKEIAAEPIESPGRVIVIYFTPKGRPQAKDHVKRVRRIVETTASFYEDELARHGFPNRKMNVRRDADGAISIIDVEGKDRDYDKPDGSKIRGEIIPVLKSLGIDPSQSVLLMFCNLMDYAPKLSRISHHSPYYGGGSYLAGNAWQCDSEILDPLRFKDLTPIRDGEYGRITIGRHNSIFIGGVVHELGHALSLPHCKQRADEAVRGTALMGSGNRTFRQELRGEGRGTFLTQAHALRLAAHPAFLTKVTYQLRDRPQTSWDELRIDVADDNTIRIKGRVSGEVLVHGVVAYFDPAQRGDYDATTATAFPDESGWFEMRSVRLRPNWPGELRLLACHINGATRQRAMSYRIDENGRPDLAAIRLKLELSPMIDALREGDTGMATKQLNELANGDAELKAIGQRVLDRFLQRDANVKPASIDPDSIRREVKTVALSSLKPTSARVGWIRPSYDRVPSREVLLSIDGDFFAKGIYAHAPARHVYKIDKKWNRLTGTCGIQSGNRGKVDFEIVGDGKLLWNQRGVQSGKSFSFNVDVSRVRELTLVVTNGGNGNASDWGVWIKPTLQR